MELEKKIQVFSDFGKFLNEISKSEFSESALSLSESQLKLFRLSKHILNHNPWFTYDQVRQSFRALGFQLQEEKLRTWISRYPGIEHRKKPLRVGVVMAGNIPAVGFHDLLCVLMAGHTFVGKPSRKEGGIIPHMVSILTDMDPEFSDCILLTEDFLPDPDVVIATGSDNSARYFEYLYKNIPALIRKNRNGIAVLSGKESLAELQLLRTDIFSYFGLGCRNVSKIYIPLGYNFNTLLSVFKDMPGMLEHAVYLQNIKYQRALMALDDLPCHDAETVLLREESAISSPIGMLHYEYYTSLDQLKKKLSGQDDQIQCTVGSPQHGFIPFGQSQYPELWDYADHVDTLRFLTDC